MPEKGEMGGCAMKGKELSKPEVHMREVIRFLLSLPLEQREVLELAENYGFTMARPAAPWPSVAARKGATPSCTWEGDTVACARMLAGLGVRVAMLNFAHGYNCGGGFEHAAGSQEEAIFRASSVFLSLWPHRREDDGPGVLKRGLWIGDFDGQLPRKEAFYEHSQCGGIYSPHVQLLDTGAEGFSLGPRVAVLTAAAQDLTRVKPFCKDLLRQKLRSILRMAAEHGDEALVLGAFGCGYFGNPPEAVAEVFQELLSSEFQGVFRLCVFALLRDRNYASFVRHFPVASHEELQRLLGAGAEAAEASKAE